MQQNLIERSSVDRAICTVRNLIPKAQSTDHSVGVDAFIWVRWSGPVRVVVISLDYIVAADPVEAAYAKDFGFCTLVLHFHLVFDMLLVLYRVIHSDKVAKWSGWLC